MQTGTLIESKAGFQIEFCGAVTGAPTWDLQVIARLLSALGVRQLDLRIDYDLDEVEQLMWWADAVKALRGFRESLRLPESAEAC